MSRGVDGGGDGGLSRPERTGGLRYFPAMPTLLAIHAHPDDESSKGAATVARYAAAGVRCVLVTATGGEVGDVLNPAMDTPEVRGRLAEIRRDELMTAAAIIGYDEVIMLGYRDSGMPDTEPNNHPDAFVNVAENDALERIVAIIRKEQPDVVLGYDDNNRYRHPDHVRVHELAMAAFDAAADPDRFPAAGPAWAVAKLYAPIFSVRRIRALHAAMEARDLDSPFTERLERIGDATDDGRVITSIEVGTMLERGREALRAHATQVDPNGYWFTVPLEVAIEAYPYEDFELLGARVPVDHPETDLFDGI